MSRNKIAYIERIVDKHGIERIYGYDAEGKKYFLNLHKVIEEYQKRGIKNFERVV